jgi:hypothetical protein
MAKKIKEATMAIITKLSLRMPLLLGHLLDIQEVLKFPVFQRLPLLSVLVFTTANAIIKIAI